MLNVEQWIREFPIEQVRARILELDAERKRLQDAITLFDRMSGSKGPLQPPEPSMGGSPRGGPASVTPYHKHTREAIKALIDDSPPGDWRPQDIKRALFERGWLLPDKDNAVDAAMPKLVKEGILEKVGPGLYRTPVLSDIGSKAHHEDVGHLQARSLEGHQDTGPPRRASEEEVSTL